MSAQVRRLPFTIRPEERSNRVRADPARRAEVKVYDALREQMGPGWTVFYSVPWLSPARQGSPRDGGADFIVAHPAKGVLLIEVKGGGISYDGRRQQLVSSLLQHHYQGADAISPRGPVGRSVETHTYQNVSELSRLFSATLNRLVTSERIQPDDIVVLTPRSLAQSALRTLHLPGPIQLRTDGPQPGRPGVLLASVQSFKGLERRVAVVAELDEGLLDNVEEAERMCYVAFSRARTHLVLIGTPDILPALLPEA